WSVLASWIITVIVIIVIFFMVYLQVNGIINSSSDPIIELNDLSSKVLAYGSIMMILTCISSVFVVLFSVFLIKVKEVRFITIAGIMMLVSGIVVAFSSGFFSYILLYPGDLLNNNLSSGVSGMMNIFGGLYYSIIKFVLILVSLVLGSLSLINASKSSRKL
ncbi:MAG: hypothetical protein KC506_03965, partial [Nanoarchaeota archaeon]|nr:hypothetical protein [Nanoarchaeota archaeon]